VVCICSRIICYVCNRDITVQKYDHFRSGPCPLFSTAGAVVDRGARERVQMAARMMYRAHGADVVPCIFCRQEVVRLNRQNRLRCGVCRRVFCFRCKQEVRNTVTHFQVASGGCPQHDPAPEPAPAEG
jgi:hypothetical protein